MYLSKSNRPLSVHHVVYLTSDQYTDPIATFNVNSVLVKLISFTIVLDRDTAKVL